MKSFSFTTEQHPGLEKWSWLDVLPKNIYQLQIITWKGAYTSIISQRNLKQIHNVMPLHIHQYRIDSKQQKKQQVWWEYRKIESLDY